MRAEKRKKNAPKELARLKQALSQDKKADAVMADLQEIATVVPAEQIRKQADVELLEAADNGQIYTDKRLLFLYSPAAKMTGSVARRREDERGQQAQQENNVGRKRSVPHLDESATGQEAERQAGGKESRSGQEEEEGHRLVSPKTSLRLRLKDC